MGLSKSRKVKEEILDEVLATFTLIGIPIIVASIIITLKFGWSFLIIGHSLSILLLGLLYFIRRYVALNIKGYLLCVLILFIGINGAYYLGIHGGWQFIIIAMSLLITFLFGRILGLLLLAISIAASIVSYLYLSIDIAPNLIEPALNTVYLLWFNSIISVLLMVCPLFIFISKLNLLIHINNLESIPDKKMTSNVDSDLTSLFDIVSMPVLVYRSNDEVVYLNKNFIEIFGFDLTDIGTINDFIEKGLSGLETRQAAFLEWIKGADIAREGSNLDNETNFIFNTNDGKEVEASISFKAFDHQMIVIFSIQSNSDQLANTTQEIEDSIKLKYDEFIKLNEELLQSNDEITEMNQKLLIAKNRAEESDLNKTVFLRNMSHQMRTPLNAIIGFTEMLKYSDFEDSQRESYVDIVLNSGYQLADVVNDVVYASTIESKNVSLFEEACDINDMINSIVLAQKGKAKEKNLKLTTCLTLDTSESVMLIDGKKVQDIISKLLHNAIKFTSKGSISIGYNIRNNFIVFSVKDTGIGIKQEHHQLIFDRYSKASNGVNHKTDGIGLGLFISKSLVELMGGKIWFISEEGKGVTFFFTVPYKPRNLIEVNQAI